MTEDRCPVLALRASPRQAEDRRKKENWEVGMRKAEVKKLRRSEAEKKLIAHG